ncbi:imm11 family protein [Cystobacter ferrugineus]
MTAQMRYYRIDDDKYIPGRWYLRMPRTDEAGRGEMFDVWRFSEGRFLTIEHPIRMRLMPAGTALEFSHAFGIPIVHHRVVALFERLGLQREVQFIPVEIEGQSEPFFILNVLQIIRCIDDGRCDEVFYWRPEDGEPDRVGHYKNVRGLKVDPARVGDANIFRPWGWTVVLIVSERVKLAMDEEGITGTDFTEV